MLILSEKCKRCGKEFIPAPCHVYRIGAELFCSYTCHLHEVTEREEAKRQKEEEALERKRFYDKKRNFEKYRFGKDNMTPLPLKSKGYGRPVVKISPVDGSIVARYSSQHEAAEKEFVSTCTMSRWLTGKAKRKSEFIWKYEDEL